MNKRVVYNSYFVKKNNFNMDSTNSSLKLKEKGNYLQY